MEILILEVRSPASLLSVNSFSSSGGRIEKLGCLLFSKILRRGSCSCSFGSLECLCFMVLALVFKIRISVHQEQLGETFPKFLNYLSLAFRVAAYNLPNLFFVNFGQVRILIRG